MIEFEFITTRGGDTGKSSLFGGERRHKTDSIFAVLGDIDELTSSIGLSRSLARSLSTANSRYVSISDNLYRIQQELQNIASLIATPVSSLNRIRPLKMNDSEWEIYLKHQLETLEEVQKTYMQHIEVSGFIIPGDSELSARLDLARSVCRRAERSCVQHIQQLALEAYRLVQNYLNRLSDCLFVMARYADQVS